MLAVATAHADTYTVRNGDSDWTIAHKHGLKVNQLHQMNPGVDWPSLQIGRKLNVPSSKYASEKSKKAETKSSKLVSSGSKTTVYKVRDGENGWIIAHRFGIRTPDLKSLNKGVDLKNLHIGQQIVVPKTNLVATHKEKVNHIRTSYALVNSENVSIRREPSTSSGRITTVDTGTRVKVLAREGAWYKLRFPRGTEGWVRGDFLNPAHKVASTLVAHGKRRSTRGRSSSGSLGYIAQGNGEAAALMKSAASYSGVRYRWGGASRSGTDCSGFTTQVFRSQGVKLPRTSQEQSQVGKQVSKSSLEKGDLVFFRTTRGRRVSHVGIYVGNGKFIHSSSGSGHVQVSSLAEGYYSNRFVGGRRVKKFAESKKKEEAPKSSPQPVSETPVPEESGK